MSYCRFGEADVYIYADVGGGITCCGCGLEGESAYFNTPTEEGMLEHIKAHRAAGDSVPLDVDARLLKEISERDTGETCNVYVVAEEREESYLAQKIGLPMDEEIAPITQAIRDSASSHFIIKKALQHLKEHEQHISESRSEDFFKGYTHALRELEFYNEAGRVLRKP